jgi:hypothetical protein
MYLYNYYIRTIRVVDMLVNNTIIPLAAHKIYINSSTKFKNLQKKLKRCLYLLLTF